MAHRLLLGLVVLLGPPSAQADCFPPNHFDDADLAKLVFVGKAGAAASPGGWPMVVERVLEGQPGRQREVPVSPMLFLPSAGQRYVLFLTADGRNLEGCPTISLSAPSLAELGVSEAELLEKLQRFVAAPDGDVRRALLVEVATMGRTELAGQAAERLTREISQLARVSPREREAIVRALAGPAGRGADRLALLAARLRALEALPHMIALLDNRGVINPRLIEDALELLTNHHPPGVEHGLDFTNPAIPPLQRHWRAWELGHRGRSTEQRVADGYRERGVKPPVAGDRHALARLVTSGPDHLTRAVAAEALERATGGPSTFPVYLHGAPSQAQWEALASRLVGARP